MNELLYYICTYLLLSLMPISAKQDYDLHIRQFNRQETVTLQKAIWLLFDDFIFRIYAVQLYLLKYSGASTKTFK